MNKAVLWDIDGTILNFLEAEKVAIRKCFEIHNLGECTDEMIEAYSKINVKYWQALEKGEMTKPEILVGRFREFFTVYGLDVNCAEAFNSDYQIRLGDTICFMPNAMATIEELKNKMYIQCAVTNGTKIAQDRKLANSGLDKIFDYIFISEEIGIEKPGKGFFDVVFQKTGLKADEMIIIGDSLTSDIRGGNNAGIKAIWFNPYHKEKNTDVHVDYEVDDLYQVISYLE